MIKYAPFATKLISKNDIIKDKKKLFSRYLLKTLYIYKEQSFIRYS